MPPKSYFNNQFERDYIKVFNLMRFFQNTKYNNSCESLLHCIPLRNEVRIPSAPLSFLLERSKVLSLTFARMTTSYVWILSSGTNKTQSLYGTWWLPCQWNTFKTVYNSLRIFYIPKFLQFVTNAYSDWVQNTLWSLMYCYSLKFGIK